MLEHPDLSKRRGIPVAKGLGGAAMGFVAWLRGLRRFVRG
jgi:hypothetical protein